MARRFVVVGVLYLASVAAAGVIQVHRSNEAEKGKDPEKKPNIVRDYVCLRDGELCHPEFGRNRGLYVSCSNGVAWELQCPKCSYHPVNCPTRTLWFDGEKCEWASPKLASGPCIDQLNFTNGASVGSAEKDVSDQVVLLQSLQALPMNMKDSSAEKNKWTSPMQNSPMYFKSPKSGDLAPEEEKDSSVQEAVKVETEDNLANLVSEAKKQKKEAIVAAEEESEEDSSNVEQVHEIEKSNKLRRKSSEESVEHEFPTSLYADNGVIGSMVMPFNNPVFTLVQGEDGKNVLMRLAQSFVLDDPSRSVLPNVNILSSPSDKE